MDRQDQSRRGLQALEPMLQLVLDTLPVRVFWKDLHSIYLGCNLPFALDAGLRHPNEIIGRKDLDLPWREQAALYRGDDQAVMSSGTAKLNYEEPETGLDGSCKWLRTSKIPLKTAEGEIIGVLGTYEDITERRATEDALHRTIQVMENSPAVVFRRVSGQPPRVELVSRNIGQLGYSAEELISGTVRLEELVCAEDLPRITEEIRAALEKGADRFQVKCRLLAKDGQARWMECYVLIEREEVDRPRAYQGILIDRTERMRAEQALLESERKYRQLVNNSLLGFFVTQSHLLKFCNQRLADMFGYHRPEEMVGKGTREMVDPQYWSTVVAAVRERETSRSPGRSVQVRCVRRDGSRFDAEVIGSRIEYEGQPALQGSLIDITARLQMEAEQERLKEQLIQAQKMESIGRLAGGIAHDLNNLLSPVVGYSELLLKDFSSADPRRGYVAEINTVAERAKRLIRQLLAFGRKQVLELRLVDLRRVLQGFENILRRTIRENIRIEMALPDHLGLVQADVVQIEQVLLNLAVNAQDAMPTGGVLSFALAEETIGEDAGHPDEPPPGNWIVLTVRDTGPGIDPAILDNLFDPFFTTKEVGKGIGLGLATVYGIVAQHDGHILVDPRSTAGATFRICLPRAEAKDQALPVSPVEPVIESGRERILLVEDNETVRQVTRLMLERQGYQVLAAEGPIQAIALFEQEQRSVDLLLTDVVMPGMNGRELFESLGKGNPSLKVLFMSGYDPGVVTNHGIANGEACFLQKPFTAAALAEKIRLALGRRHPSS
ncbi:MAG: PAS domain S-box protein [Bradymonadales bacterium]|nr:PAS domain S-box protein [Bradymonadales bacterium]